ncbi:MAG: Signal transduction histidine kinase [Hyphomicrobiales bacterium]|nr:Signal transduction histidine kinase [Hyphomicrobiales bacterium]
MMTISLTERTRTPITVRRLFKATFQTTTFLGLAAFVVAYVTLAVYLQQQRERTLNDAHVTAQNLTRAFEQHIVRSIKSVDQALLFARGQYERDPQGFEVTSRASRDYYLSDLAVQMAIIGPDGLLRNSNLASAGPVDLTDREHFQVHVHAAGDDLFISKPVLGRVSNRWTIQLTRKIRKPDGSFGGVLVASLDPYELSRLYESIDIGAGGAITLVGTDGIIRARGGMNANVLGKSLASSNMLRRVAGAPSGTFEGVSEVDGIERVISYRKVDAYPLIVTVALTRNEALADFEMARDALWHMMTMVAAFLTATMVWGVIQRSRLDATRESLLSQAQILSSTLANMQEGILMIDGANDVVVMNDRARSLLSMADTSFTLPFPSIHLPFDSSKEAKTQEHRFATGTVLEIHTTPIRDGGYVKTFIDITDRKLNQRVLEEARDKAEAASRARTAFLATMSHEIRTPLGGVLSMVDLIATTRLDDAQRHYLDITRGSAEHLLQLIDDILDVTKLDAEKLKFENIVFDFHRMVRDTLELVAPKAIASGLSVGCLISSDVPREIESDPGRLRQILLNLIGNAIKFTAHGHVLLEVSCKHDASGGLQLIMRFEDTGIGIAKENLQDLFRDFSQIDSSISRRFGGTGLGLAICRKLSTRMGGHIRVESTLGVGTTFIVELPMKKHSGIVPVIPDTALVAIAATNVFDRTLLRRQIEPAFAEVSVFDTISDGCAWLETQASGARRILLVDHSLAPVAGLSTALLQRAASKRIEPFLVHARQDLMAEAAERGRGYAGFVQKPVFLDSLRESLMHIRTAGVQKGTPTGPSPTHGALAGMQVLFAEDNTTNQFALGRILELMGAQVTVVGNGREAVEHASAGRYDFILMDMMMPELDGLSATRAIRCLPSPLCDVPIVALTANAFVEDREAALAAGMNGFATKPITGKRLLEAIQDCLRERGYVTIEPEAQVVDEVSDARDFELAVLESLREELGPDYVDAAIDIFLNDLNTRLEAMKNPDMPCQMLGAHGHALKSSAATFGLTKLARAAEDIEQAVRKGETSGLNQQMRSFVAEAAHAPARLKRQA